MTDFAPVRFRAKSMSASSASGAIEDQSFVLALRATHDGHCPCPLSLPKTSSGTNWVAKCRIVSSSHRMLGMVELLLHSLASLVKSRRRLEAENLVLRHQVNILLRRASRCQSARKVDL